MSETETQIESVNVENARYMHDAKEVLYNEALNVVTRYNRLLSDVLKVMIEKVNMFKGDEVEIHEGDVIIYATRDDEYITHNIRRYVDILKNYIYREVPRFSGLYKRGKNVKINVDYKIPIRSYYVRLNKRIENSSIRIADVILSILDLCTLWIYEYDVIYINLEPAWSI